jgi:hypothetical protein
VIEEGRKIPRNSRYEKKIPQNNEKIKKRLQIFLYLVIQCHTHEGCHGA